MGTLAQAALISPKVREITFPHLEFVAKKWLVICQWEAIYHNLQLQVHGLKIRLSNALAPGCAWVHCSLLSHVMGAPCQVPYLESRDAHRCPCRLSRAGDCSERSRAITGPHMSILSQWSYWRCLLSWWSRWILFLFLSHCGTLYHAWVYSYLKITFSKVFRLNLTPFIALREQFEMDFIVYLHGL